MILTGYGTYTAAFFGPARLYLIAIPLLYSVIIHEVAHGWVAEKMGDSTARWRGRLSLDPPAISIPSATVTLFLFGFGWAKPVPVNFNNLRPHRRGLVFVLAAGIAANIILAFLARWSAAPSVFRLSARSAGASSTSPGSTSYLLPSTLSQYRRWTARRS